RGERAKETAPDATRVFEIKSDTDDAAEENVDEPFVIEVGGEPAAAVFSLEQQMECGRKNGLRPNPSEHSHEEQKECDRQDHLPRHVQSVPERAVRHFVALAIAHRLRER